MQPSSGHIEIINTPPPLGLVKHALVDFDGTISLIREGWEGIMAPVMFEAICGGDPPPEIREAVYRYIDESTGIETILQMERLVEMVREFGFVPEDRILDAQGYKAIYVARIRAHVRDTVEALERGHADPEEHRVPGALQLLEALRARGIELYVVSGTDDEDVKREARAVGIFDVAGGRVYGSQRTFAEFSKGKFIKRLFEEQRLSGPELLVVGDGPVEIRLARERGAITIGVASSPKRDGAVSPARRERLIRAGAHAIVPDFAHWPSLMEWLFPHHPIGSGRED